jgi:pilus assembly protein Flp/PilA
MLDFFRNFASPTRRNEEGASAVEYGLLVALIAAVIVTAVLALGGTVSGILTNTNNCTDNAVGTACTPRN